MAGKSTSLRRIKKDLRDARDEYQRAIDYLER